MCDGIYSTIELVLPPKMLLCKSCLSVSVCQCYCTTIELTILHCVHMHDHCNERIKIACLCIANYTIYHLLHAQQYSYKWLHLTRAIGLCMCIWHGFFLIFRSSRGLMTTLCMVLVAMQWPHPFWQWRTCPYVPTLLYSSPWILLTTAW